MPGLDQVLKLLRSNRSPFAGVLSFALIALFASACNLHASYYDEGSSGYAKSFLLTANANQYAQDVFVKLEAAAANGSVDRVMMSLSVPVARTKAGICVFLQSSTEVCSSQNAVYVEATRLATQPSPDYGIFQIAQPIDVVADRVVHIIDPTSQLLLRKIHFVGGQQPTLPLADPIEAGLALIKEEALREELAYFSSDELNGRLAGTAENEKAAQYIIGRLQELQIAPAKPNEYRQKFKLPNGPMQGKETANLVAVLPGQDPTLSKEFVVIGAHLDHTGTLERGYTCSEGADGSNSICNGADDNGSGTIAVLNVAKALSAVRSSLKRTVVLMWFSGEEEGLRGSYHYVDKEPIFALDKTVYMINLDMVGYMESNGNKLGALGGGTSDVGSEIIKVIGEKYRGRAINITEKAGGGSDHVPFMAQGIPGVFFHTGVSNNPNYHRTSDTHEKIDFPGMHVAAKVAFELAFRMAKEESLTSTLYLNGEGKRQSLVTPEEMKQTCHHLMQNPYVGEALDFTYSNSGRRP